ncbi:MAG: type II secretion system protein [Acidobacteriota bacterium]
MRPRNRATSQSGFTLAGVIVLMTIMMVFVAYTVPRQWSAILQRDRERQTIYAMQQYARACLEFQRKNQTYPVNPSQLKEARSPRLIRGLDGELVDPLTGEVDWLVIPQAAAQAIGPGPQPPPTGTNPQPPPALPGIPLKDYAGGPFVGVRPPISGKSMLALNGNETYETWSYTAIDLQRDVTLRVAGLQTVWK